MEFLTVDGRVHTVAFSEEDLGDAVAGFLRRTDQMRSPPLVDRGSRFVLTFEDAPGGRYRYRAESSGGGAWGEILVEAEP